MPPHDHEPNSRKLKQRATLGCTEQVQVARQVRRDHRSQDPWIARKLAVMIVMGLVAYSTYVYVRMCVDMIRERRGALGSRAEGSKSHLRERDLPKSMPAETSASASGQI